MKPGPPRISLVAVAVVFTTAGATAQELPVVPAPGAPSQPSWMVAWSPLTAYADLPRELPRAPGPLRLLSAPPPRSGAFWTAGNAAALVRDAADPWSSFRAGHGSADDGFRRPLDPQEPRIAHLIGLGWRRLTHGVSVIGRAQVVQKNDRPGSRAMFLEPHTSNPWVPTDTTTPDVSVAQVRLEGGSAYSHGPWSLGFAVGYEATDGATERSTLPRSVRSSQAGASAGLGRSLFSGSFWVGLEGRWRTGSEDASTRAPEASARVVSAVLHGYAEPEPEGPQPTFRRRGERDERSLSASTAGALGTVGGWAAFLRLSDLEEIQTSVVSDPSFDDHWRADGLSAGLDGWTSVPWKELRATWRLRWMQVDGEAERHDLTGAIFQSDESSIDLRFDVRKRFRGGRWAGGIGLEARRQSRVRRDLIQRDFTDITTRDLGASVEVARRIGGVAVSLSYGALLRSPDGRLLATPPDGSIRERLIDPSLALESAEALAQSWELTVAWSPPTGVRTWGRLSFARVHAQESDSPISDGSALSVSVGVVLPN